MLLLQDHLLNPRILSIKYNLFTLMSSKFHLERKTNTFDDVISIKSVNFSESFCSTTSG